jgi:hypothetical protein
MEKDVYKAASIVPDPLKPNSEVHISAENPLQKYHKVIDILQDIFNDLRKSIIGGSPPTASKGRRPVDPRKRFGSVLGKELWD